MAVAVLLGPPLLSLGSNARHAAASLRLSAALLGSELRSMGALPLDDGMQGAMRCDAAGRGTADVKGRRHPTLARTHSAMAAAADEQ